MANGKTLVAKFAENALSPKMERVKDNFFKLFREEYIDSVSVRPVHGEFKGHNISIHERDIYSVMAYKKNVAALRVSRKICDENSGMTLPGGRNGLVFVTADEEYM
jgi:hypothetical protein